MLTSVFRFLEWKDSMLCINLSNDYMSLSIYMYFDVNNCSYLWEQNFYRFYTGLASVQLFSMAVFYFCWLYTQYWEKSLILGIYFVHFSYCKFF